MTASVIFFLIAIVIAIIIFANSKNKKSSTTYINKDNDDYSSSNSWNTAYQEVEIPVINSAIPSHIKGKYLVFDTETTGFQPARHVSIKSSSHWPYILQIAWSVLDENFNTLISKNYYTTYNGVIPVEASRVNKITKAILKEKGVDTLIVLQEFLSFALSSEHLVAHNINFDFRIIQAELYRNGFGEPLVNAETICTMEASKTWVNASNINGGLKYPKLSELYAKCFGESDSLTGMHNALNDVNVTAMCFSYMVKNEILSPTGQEINFDIALRRRVQKYRPDPSAPLVFPKLAKYRNLSDKEYKLKLAVDNLVDLGKEAEKEVNYEKAIKFYQQAIENKCNYTTPFDRLRIIYRKLKEYDKVIQIINQAIDYFESTGENGQNLDRFYEHLEKEMISKEKRNSKK